MLSKLYTSLNGIITWLFVVSPPVYQTFDTWHSYVQRLVCQNGYVSPRVVPHGQVQRILHELETVLASQLGAVTGWLHDGDKTPDALKAELAKTGAYKFIPYVQRLPLTAGSRVMLHGDLHGNVQALTTFIADLNAQGYMDKSDPFKIADPQVYIIFLGDYVDRGRWGIETLYTLARLKIANPERVYMVRGNHEDGDINKRNGWFYDELHDKYGIFKDSHGNSVHNAIFDTIQHIYNKLPLALYLQIGDSYPREYIMCCHGGWEFGYNPGPLLNTADEHITHHALSNIDRNLVFQKLPSNLKTAVSTMTYKYHGKDIPIPQEAYSWAGALDIKSFGRTKTLTCGFLWDDFVPDDGTIVTEFNPLRGWRWGKPLLDAVRSQTAPSIIRAIFRAHQHGDKALLQKMTANKAGVAKLWQPLKKQHETIHMLWDGMVCTFLVTPYTGYGNIFDAWGELQVGHSFATSTLIMHHNDTHVGEHNTVWDHDGNACKYDHRWLARTTPSAA
jgi:hypothetical protein